MDAWNNKLPERLPFSKKRLPKKVIFSYIVDYVIIVALLAFFVVVDKIEPFHQPFSLDNYTLHYPFAKKERITVMSAGLIAVAFPMVVIVFYTLVIDGLFSHETTTRATRGGLKRLTGRYRLKDRLWELNCGLLGLMLSVCGAFSITGALKNAIGKPRPDLIARCMVRGGLTHDVDLNLTTIAICDQKDNYILQDGFKSFPSAHSSVGFAGLFYLSLYLAAKLHVLDSKGEVWKSLVVLIPSLAASLVAGSRIMDARHHPFDVLSGSLLGILVAWGSYRQYFPPVSETWRKGRAYPIRSWGRGPAPPPTPAINVDEDVVPLRVARSPSDVERGEASGFSTEALAAGLSDPGRNVFREQIHQSQRRRQQDGTFGLQPSDTMGSTYSQKVAGYQGQLPSANPFAPRRHDNYDYSSSEDEEAFELQQPYSRGDVAQTGAAYNPVSRQLSDTGYHGSSGGQPSTQASPTNDTSAQRIPTGDLGDGRHPAPAPPPHATGTAF